LAIINFLNSQSQQVAEGEGSSVLLTSAVTSAASQSPVISLAPGLVIDTAQSSSSLAYRSTTGAALDTRAVDTLFYHHRQAENTSTPRDTRVDDTASTLVSDDLLEILADRDSNEI
jgi:hypothetical protein